MCVCVCVCLCVCIHVHMCAYVSHPSLELSTHIAYTHVSIQCNVCIHQYSVLFLFIFHHRSTIIIIIIIHPHPHCHLVYHCYSVIILIAGLPSLSSLIYLHHYWSITIIIIIIIITSLSSFLSLILHVDAYLAYPTAVPMPSWTSSPSTWLKAAMICRSSVAWRSLRGREYPLLYELCLVCIAQ